MNIRKAKECDIDAVEQIYNKIHQGESEGKYTTGWLKGVYPVRKTAEAALERDDLFILEDENEIRGVGIINQIQMDGYEKASWKHRAADNEVCVFHTLVIPPEFKGKGYGTKFIEYYENYARDHGWPELRFDTNERNRAARTLYRRLGYEEIAVIPTVFNNIPDVNLVLFEKYLDLDS